MSQSEPKSDSQTLTLPSGRTIGYASYGSPTGHPVLFFHGFPSSRLEAYAISSMASKRNLRIISPDRPGFGLSTPLPHRKITDYPFDIQDFTSALNLKKFAIIGASGGGPYALACAKEIPAEKLSAVGVLAGAAVWDNGVRTSEVPWYSRLTYLGAHYWPSGLRVFATVFVGFVRWVTSRKWVEGKIEGLLDAATKAKAAKEKKEDSAESLVSKMGNGEESEGPVRTMAQKRKDLMGLLFEGFTQGSAEVVNEAKLLSLPDWGFKFEDITYDRILLWHGSKDVNAPVVRIRTMAERIPHSVLKEFDENHFGMGYHIEEVLDDLVAEIERNERREES